MFEKAVVRGPGVSHHVDVGLLAETLLFYSSVHLILNRGSLASLLRELGPETFLELLNRPGVAACYVQNEFGVLSNTTDGIRFDRLSAFAVGSERKAHPTPLEDIEQVVTRALANQSDPRKLAKRLFEKIAPYKFPKDHGVTSIVHSAEEDLATGNAARELALTVIESLIPGYAVPAQFQFEVNKISDAEGYLVSTNLEQLRIDLAYRQLFPPTHSSLTSPYILSHVLNARADAFFAADYMAELVTGPVYSSVIRKKHFDFIRRRTRSEFDIHGFQDLVFDNGSAVREAINTKQKTFSEFLVLLDNATKYKDWLLKASPDASVVKAYFEELRRSSWVDKLPSKTMRFVLATGMGVLAEAIAPSGIGLATGIGLGAGDTFLLDRILRGWRPSQFVEGPLSEFVDAKAK